MVEVKRKATFERHATQFPGVYFRWGTHRGTGKPEKIYYIAYLRGGKKIDEKCGRERADDLTASRTNGIRAKKIDGEPSRMDKREAIRKAREVEASKMTFDALWKKWQLFIAYTGIRRGSVQNLKWKDIDLDNATADRPHPSHDCRCSGTARRPRPLPCVPPTSCDEGRGDVRDRDRDEGGRMQESRDGVTAG